LALSKDVPEGITFSYRYKSLGSNQDYNNFPHTDVA